CMAASPTGLSFTFLSGSRWYKLHSKAGKKEKERGEILVSIQFTRNNLTASMFDLSMKDKPRSPFGKLKDKVKGKKKYDLESASAIIPSSMGALDMEDDYDIGGKKSKVKGFFLKNKLRKSSLTQSNTSLGSDSTISSASLSLAANVPEVTKSPSRHSSLSTERSDYLPSPKLTHKRAFSDDVSQVSPVLEPKAIHSLKPKNDPVSRSSLCINGSHVYSDEPAPKSPVSVPQSSAPLAVPSVPRRSEEGFVFVSLPPDSHEVPWGVSTFERTQQRDEPRFIPSPPSLALQEELKVSTKAVTLSNHLGRAKMEENSRLENKPTQAAIPMVFSTETTKDKPPEEMRKEDKRAKGGLFHHGGNKSDAGSKGQGEKVGPSHGSSVHATAGGDERNKTSSWFGSKEPKESPQKPSLEVSPQVETSSDAPSHFPPCSPAQFPPAAVAHLASMPSANLSPAIGDSQSGCLSPTNPFLNSLQSNPFFEDLLADQVLNSPSPTHFFSKSPAKSVCVPKPAVPPPPLSEWDDTFDAFATSRLKPELKKENFFASVVAEGMAFIDDPDAASPTERSAEPPHEKGTKVFEKADSQIGGEMPTALRSWTNFSGLDVGANLVTAGSGGDGKEEEEGSCDVQRGSQGPWEDAEGPTADVELPRSRLSSEPSIPASPSPPTLGGDVAEAGSEFLVSEDAESAAADSAANLEAGGRELAGGDISLGEGPSEMNETDAAEQFETCPLKFSLDGLGQSGAKESWSQPGLSPPMAEREVASEQEPFPEELSTSRLNPPSKLDPGQLEIFWTALEEPEAASHPTGLGPAVRPQRLARGERPPQPEPAWGDGEGQHGPVAGPAGQAGGQLEPCTPVEVASPPREAEQGSPPASEPEGPWRWCSAESRIDFKKADFWKPARAEERCEQDASAPRNPFAAALSPSALSNPFVEKPPDPLLPVGAVLPEGLSQGGFSFTHLREEALGQGFSPTNPPGDPLGQAPFLHDSQPLAFSTPFLVAATNPKQFDFPSPVACPTSSGVPAATSRAAAQPCPLPQSGDTQASALVVLPRETQPGAAVFIRLAECSSRFLPQDPAVLDQSAKYYHLTHDELIQLLLQREKELSKKEEHIQELENYIDQLLVRIMEQSPTLLQIPLGENTTK
uniref:RAB11 family interacting protein 5 n=1 Tax=Athene cunicularia TaxID=194338 RepID=A0A663NCC9_ATHCN